MSSSPDLNNWVETLFFGLFSVYDEKIYAQYQKFIFCSLGAGFTFRFSSQSKVAPVEKSNSAGDLEAHIVVAVDTGSKIEEIIH